MNTDERLDEIQSRLNNIEAGRNNLDTRFSNLDSRLNNIENRLTTVHDKSPSQNPTLKDIEEHLKRQDRTTLRSVYFAGVIFYLSIAVVGISLWLGNTLFASNLWVYMSISAVGFIFAFCLWYKICKIKE